MLKCRVLLFLESLAGRLYSTCACGGGAIVCNAPERHVQVCCDIHGIFCGMSAVADKFLHVAGRRESECLRRFFAGMLAGTACKAFVGHVASCRQLYSMHHAGACRRIASIYWHCMQFRTLFKCSRARWSTEPWPLLRRTWKRSRLAWVGRHVLWSRDSNSSAAEAVYRSDNLAFIALPVAQVDLDFGVVTCRELNNGETEALQAEQEDTDYMSFFFNVPYRKYIHVLIGSICICLHRIPKLVSAPHPSTTYIACVLDIFGACQDPVFLSV